MKAVSLLVLTVFVGVFSSPLKNGNVRATSCGYETCHPVSSDKINVHLVPHSHDDVGWLKTVDQYFYGARNNIQRAGVQYIISSVVEALKMNPDRRFVQVETAFFWKWWNTQDDIDENTIAPIKQDFINLVNNGQIEIINGAWSMNDEACSNYQSTIDQFTWGLRILNDTLGECGIPKIGWQIDPFGHSREQASIFKQLGFDGFFFARLDSHDRGNRETNGNLDYLWQSSANLDDSEIFGSIFPEFYMAPSGFNWDIESGDTVMIDDPNSPDYNVDKKMKDFVKVIKTYRERFPTDNVLIPMGGDFQYQAAETNYLNMDKLLKAFQNHTELNVIYSNPSCYIKAVNDAKPTLKLKTDDFFPYGDNIHSYWAGYFTSRPNSKRFERTGHNILQASKQLVSLVKMSGNDTDEHDPDLKLLREAMGIMQHHDAITGTEKQHVLQDYTRILTKAIKTAEKPLGHIIGNLLSKESSDDIDLSLETCLLANVSICESSKHDQLMVVAYNPLSRDVSHYIRLPVESGKTFKITGKSDEEVKNDVVDPISDFPQVVIDGEKPSEKELVFKAEIPAFGISVYYVEAVEADEGEVTTERDTDDAEDNSLVFGTETLGFELDNVTNLLKSVTMNGQTIEISQEFLYYQGYAGDDNPSGAYLFRPINDTVAEKMYDEVKIGFKTRGELVDEVQQIFGDWVSQVIRVYKDEDHQYIEFDWLVGPIPIKDKIGKEIISRFTANEFKNNKIFYTDANGREQIQREKDNRTDYDYDPKDEPISGNYYPITSKIVIKDEEKDLEIAVLTDRSQGGASLDEGQLELMVHRRLLKDDNKGVDECLNETEFGDVGMVARGQHYLVLGPAKLSEKNGESTAAKERFLAHRKLNAPIVLVGNASDDLNTLKEKINFEFSPLKTNVLPENVQILTLETWKENTYILRLEHILEKNEDKLSEAVTFDLSDVFKNKEITLIGETTLGANQWLDEYSKKDKFVWTHSDGLKTNPNKVYEEVDLTKVTLTPMQIRTFVVVVGSK